jgi:hypothetical protein
MLRDTLISVMNNQPSPLLDDQEVAREKCTLIPEETVQVIVLSWILTGCPYRH